MEAVDNGDRTSTISLSLENYSNLNSKRLQTSSSTIDTDIKKILRLRFADHNLSEFQNSQTFF